MIRTLLGTEAFRKGMDSTSAAMMVRPLPQKILCARWKTPVAVISSSSGVGISRRERPTVTISEDWNCKSGEYSVHVKQEQPERDDYPSPGPLHIPLAIGLLDADGNELPCRLTATRKCL